jgi:hypothetical protein
MASKAITAIGTTTAMAIVPPFDRPLELDDSIAVVFEVGAIEIDEVEIGVVVVGDV